MKVAYKILAILIAGGIASFACLFQAGALLSPSPRNGWQSAAGPARGGGLFRSALTPAVKIYNY
jgi:hypothetical protein